MVDEKELDNELLVREKEVKDILQLNSVKAMLEYLTKYPPRSNPVELDEKDKEFFLDIKESSQSFSGYINSEKYYGLSKKSIQDFFVYIQWKNREILRAKYPKNERNLIPSGLTSFLYNRSGELLSVFCYSSKDLKEKQDFRKVIRYSCKGNKGFYHYIKGKERTIAFFDNFLDQILATQQADYLFSSIAPTTDHCTLTEEDWEVIKENENIFLFYNEKKSWSFLMAAHIYFLARTDTDFLGKVYMLPYKDGEELWNNDNFSSWCTTTILQINDSKEIEEFSGETKKQMEVVKWYREIFCKENNVSPLTLHYTANDIACNGKEGHYNKLRGCQSGVFDLCINVAKGGYHGFFIEMKDGLNGLSLQQEKFMVEMEKQGYKTAVCYTADVAKREIKKYFLENSLQKQEDSYLDDVPF